jgi:hypothetical protein
VPVQHGDDEMADDQHGEGDYMEEDDAELQAALTMSMVEVRHLFVACSIQRR